ncbi:MAG: lipocalin family protein [Prevotella sp.]|nr:lipocalin family protein [Prevotella sp.]
MKKTKTLGIWMLAVTMILQVMACSKDSEDNSTVNVSEAVGTWMCVESTDTYRGVSYTGLMVGTEVIIRSDGTFSSTASSSTSVMGQSGTYAINGNTITAKNANGFTFVVTATIGANKMTWKGTASNGVSFYYIFQRE